MVDDCKRILSVEDIQEKPDRSGLLLVDKPKDITSFDVIRHLRKVIGISKMGHAGTLDPMATGLLIVGVNRATKCMETLLGHDKTYLAEITLGVQTDTADADGEVLRSEKIWMKDIKPAEIEKLFEEYRGTHSLAVPIFSAIKVEGKPLYKYAREGKTPPRIPIKEMVVHDAQLLDQFEFEDSYVLRVRFSVSSGTYIRALAEDIGSRLGFPAMLSSLRRLRIGDVSLDHPKVYKLPE